MKLSNVLRVIQLGILAALISGPSNAKEDSFVITEFFSDVDLDQEWNYLLKEIDDNSDQLITWSEFYQPGDATSVDQQLEEFQEFDSNFDTQIDQQEFIALLNKPVSEEEMWPHFMELYDSNNDAIITFEEYREIDAEIYSHKMIVTMFGEYDLDADKKVTKDEYMESEKGLMDEGIVMIE